MDVSIFTVDRRLLFPLDLDFAKMLTPVTRSGGRICCHLRGQEETPFRKDRLRGLSPNTVSARRGNQSLQEISQSASQLKILEQKIPALSEHNACRRAVIGPGERVQVAFNPIPTRGGGGGGGTLCPPPPRYTSSNISETP